MFSSDFLNGLYIIPILAVLILIHEFGHFFAARLCGVKVEEFGIGIPPRLFGFVWKGVLWSVNLIPFGGFVRVKGEDGKNLDPDSMNAQPAGERAFFLSAGAGMNVLLAIALMIAVIGFQGIPHNHIYIGGVAPGSPAAKAGWQAGIGCAAAPVRPQPGRGPAGQDQRQGDGIDRGDCLGHRRPRG